MPGFLLLLAFPASAPGYSVLTHEEVVDVVWKDELQPLLLKRFPAADAEQLRRAHAYAHGGCLVQDMGYFPFGNKFFTDLPDTAGTRRTSRKRLAGAEAIASPFHYLICTAGTGPGFGGGNANASSRQCKCRAAKIYRAQRNFRNSELVSSGGVG